VLLEERVPGPEDNRQSHPEAEGDQQPREPLASLGKDVLPDQLGAGSSHREEVLFELFLEGVDGVVDGDDTPDDALVIEDWDDNQVVADQRRGNLRPVVVDVAGDDLPGHELGDRSIGLVVEQVPNRHDPREAVVLGRNEEVVDSLGVPSALDRADGAPGSRIDVDLDEFGGHQTTGRGRVELDEFADVLGLIWVDLGDALEHRLHHDRRESQDDVGGVVRRHPVEELNELVALEIRHELSGDEGVRFLYQGLAGVVVAEAPIDGEAFLGGEDVEGLGEVLRADQLKPLPETGAGAAGLAKDLGELLGELLRPLEAALYAVSQARRHDRLAEEWGGSRRAGVRPRAAGYPRHRVEARGKPGVN